MRMTGWTQLVGLLCASQVALAEPIYLDCKTSGSDGSYDFGLQVDESTGKVSVTDKDGGVSFGAEATFSVDAIQWKRVLLSNRLSTSSLNYVINRMTLGVMVVYYFEPHVARQPSRILSDRRGTCSKIDVPERKI